MSNNKLVSIILTTKNETKNIENCLKSISPQTYKNIEVIVVDNNSTDETKKIAGKYTQLVFNKGPERSAQRNFGAKQAKGKYLVFLDADMILSKNVIKECVGRFQIPGVGGVIIPEKSVGKGYWSRVKAFERSFYVGDESMEAARFFDKKAFWACGGYNENITGPEDWDLSQKIKKKYRIERVESLIIHDEKDASFLDYIKKKYYYGRGTSSYIGNHPIGITIKQIIYFLRPAFYRNWRKMIGRLDLTCGIIMLLVSEQVAGFLGFLRGQSN